MIDDNATPEDPSALEPVTDGIQNTAQQIRDAVSNAKQPRMPLDILADRVRQAPLAGLAVAFMLGVTFCIHVGCYLRSKTLASPHQPANIR